MSNTAQPCRIRFALTRQRPDSMVRRRGIPATRNDVHALWRVHAQAASWSSPTLVPCGCGGSANATFAGRINGEDIFLVGTENQVRHFAETHFENVRTVDVFGIVAHLGNFRLALASQILRFLKVDVLVVHALIYAKNGLSV